MAAERGGTGDGAERNPSGNAGSITAVVLAGGRSRRLGRDKAVEAVGGVPLVSRVISAVESVTSDLVVVVADESQGEALPLPGHARTALDLYPDSGSLGGIFTGLTAATSHWVLVVACDMPFLSRPLLSHMASVRNGVDVVAPMLDGRPEPTHALYSKTCLPYMERKLRAGRLKITGFFDSVPVNYVPQSEIEEIDPDRWSFYDVNTPEDLATARARAAEPVAGPTP